jgi:ferrochelatase
MTMTKRPAMQLPSGHPGVKTGKVGVLLVNLGTPEATDYWSMRRYLKEFLSDRRVIDVNRLLWWPLLNGIILTVRPRKSGHAYEQIWNHERNESPLKTITRAQAEGVARLLAKHPHVMVDWAMRYGKPAIGDRMQALMDAGCDRILVAPLYPQYSATTTGTVMDKVGEKLMNMRWQPALRSLPAYHDHPAHIAALAESLKAHLKGLDFKPDLVLASFHGLPKRYLMEGDPYHCHCMKTARLMAEKAGLKPGQMKVVFQSRFGNEEWLKPYAQDTIEELPGQGVKKIVMMAPGFSSDCVETLEEVGIGLKETFLENGGEKFSLVPCLNDSEVSLKMLAALCEDELQGWV